MTQKRYTVVKPRQIKEAVGSLEVLKTFSRKKNFLGKQPTVDLEILRAAYNIINSSYDFSSSVNGLDAAFYYLYTMGEKYGSEYNVYSMPLWRAYKKYREEGIESDITDADREEFASNAFSIVNEAGDAGVDYSQTVNKSDYNSIKVPAKYQTIDGSKEDEYPQDSRGRYFDDVDYQESRIKRYTLVSPSKQALQNKKLQESKKKVVRPRSVTERAIKESVFSRAYAKPGKIYSPQYNKSVNNDEDKDVDYTPNFRFGEAMKKIKASQKSKKTIKESIDFVGQAAKCPECNKLADTIYSRIQDKIAGFDGDIQVSRFGKDIEFAFDSERAYKIGAAYITINTDYEITDQGEAADEPGTFFFVIR